MTTAAAFWLRLEAAEARRRELSKVTHEMRAKKQARVSANDEPEPVIPASTRLRSILEAGQEIARNEVRRSRTAVPVLTAEEAGRS